MTEEQTCAICQQHPEDILMLECTHDLCIPCASEIYCKNGKRSSVFSCEICGAKTILDRDTITCLENMEKKHVTVAQQAMPPTPPKPKNICPEHKQPVQYFCFDCRNIDICAECILNDRHRSHNVLTYRKAAIQIVKEIEAEIRQKEQSRSKMLNDRRKISETHNLMKSQVEARRKELKIFFEEIANMLHNQQQRLQHELDYIYGNCEVSLKGQLDLIDSKSSEIGQQIEKMQAMLKENQRNIIVKFGKRQVARIQQVKMEHCGYFIQIEYGTDILSQIATMIHKITIKNEKPLTASHHGSISRTRTEAPLPQTPQEQPVHHPRMDNPTQPLRLDHLISHKKKVHTETPTRPQLKQSLDMASNIISKLQTRQKKFE